MTDKSVKNKGGRPSLYTPEIAEQILQEIAGGKDLIQVCSQPGMPSRWAVNRWLDSVPGFATQYARAREMLADLELHRLKEIAESCTEENVNSTRVKLNHFQWRLMKIAPRTYGDKTQTEVTGAGGGPVQLAAVDLRGLSDAELATMQALLGKASE